MRFFLNLNMTKNKNLKNRKKKQQLIIFLNSKNQYQKLKKNKIIQDLELKVLMIMSIELFKNQINIVLKMFIQKKLINKQD